MADNDEVLRQGRVWLADGRKVALATVAATWGSSPRPVGSLLAVADDGAFVGSVSGGCIEGAVIKEAQEAMADGRPRLLDFGISDEMAWEVGLACGGELKVYLERADDPALLDRLLAERPLALATDVATGAHAVVRGDAVDGDLQPDIAALDAIRHALHDDRGGLVESGPSRLLVRPFNPPLRMAVVGAVHVAQSLVPMAVTAGFRVTVIDPRRAFATADRFPGVTLSDDWPDEALEAMAPDERTAVVVLTHDPKLDDPALTVALASDAFYVGALGSRKTHAKRLDRLRQAGLDEAALARIRAPIGLDIGGSAASEIAVSIIAEVVAMRHGKVPPP